MSIPSSNWAALQKKLGKSTGKEPPRKRRKIAHNATPELFADISASPTEAVPEEMDPMSCSKATMKKMVLGQVSYSDEQRKPGKYICIDCEMVGVGIEGRESSLARVSVVNLYGAVLMDEFVKQKEKVVDYRTQFSGVRPSDLVHARSFDTIATQVAGLLKDRILVGHAVHNDLKALLLSHPQSKIRDTQSLAKKFSLTKSRHMALRDLVKQELGVVIQGGEHSSVTDARATMAVYRLHQKEWEGAIFKPPKPKAPSKTKPASITLHSTSQKRTSSYSDGSATPGSGIEQPETPGAPSKFSKHPGQGRKGISSGLSTIVKRNSKGSGTKDEWWKRLPTGAGV